MSNVKFKRGDTVLHNNEKKVVVVSSKNFSTGVIAYVLEGSTEKIPQNVLKAVKGKMTRKKKPSKKEQAAAEKALLQGRLKQLFEYQEMIEASEGYNESEYHKAVSNMTNEDFEKFLESCIEKSLSKDDGNQDNTED